MNNQYGFMPQRGTTDAAIAVKDFVEKGLVAGKVSVSNPRRRRCL
jgi:hypothetical protein